MNEKLYKKLVGKAMEMDLEKNDVLWNSGGLIMWQNDMKRLIQETAKECLSEIERCTYRNGDTEHNRALGMAWDNIKEKFGVESSS